MDYKIIEGLLNSKEVNRVKKIMSRTNLPWQGGGLSVYEDGKRMDDEKVAHFKKNQQLNPEADDPASPEISSIIFSGTDRCFDWHNFVCPLSSRTPLITRTNVGGYYKLHHDASGVGHFSTSIFLNEPDDYDGGELCLDLNGDIKQVKLPAGSSVTYRTGIPHCVNPVTSGHRDVAVFWSMTKFPDPHEWRIYKGISRAIEHLPNKLDHLTIEESRDDPYFILMTIMYDMERRSLVRGN